eukprot:1410996-Lingulodinium_polyedra.AAC.1
MSGAPAGPGRGCTRQAVALHARGLQAPALFVLHDFHGPCHGPVGSPRPLLPQHGLQRRPARP